MSSNLAGRANPITYPGLVAAYPPVGRIAVSGSGSVPP